MNNILSVPNSHFHSIQDLTIAFKKDVQTGLQKTFKQLPSKYLYDDLGCEIFNKITRHSDYYLTSCEIDILHQSKNSLAKQIGNEAFNLVELGPGEGIKTRILIDAFISNNLKFIYTPIDINDNYLIKIINNLKTNLPGLHSKGIHSDYFDGLSWISQHSDRRNLILFLGSNIGNFDAANTKIFLTHLWETLKHGDLVLIGFDLCKDLNVLMKAYNDSDGLTRDFNLNLLKRMNRELNANFNINKFQHYPHYNPHNHSMESYVVSLEDQLIRFNSFNQVFHFNAFDTIHLEYSQKFQLNKLPELAAATGFQLLQNYIDEKHYFADSLWVVEKN